ncbi:MULTISPECIES: 50S ribosomal protein L17 [Tepidanaerobacter]|uniref:Large ribosomal subunit protein bL17 n=1 Tax=Tepidanaerobacter syntrophicus TaxID=224999 RepID=A0A0U9HCY0_9FIRM|nr:MULTISPECIES: 50S ribosomal protein L17 [Tepidanaerobacter]GAQ24665.1 large subunit ribosomal protein L17 [Tepidanaerobacter syntrophicus]GLI19065.1 50S ribosomal protein L17 [Tepidanaerobacter syntrophicus]GLI51060.1 50S ribosomal protein L17 [Tepidanaerobacter syntrophicus]HHV83420.1 50S ribosomal protein L17 [Tepidanaerobacter syntrophicus]
MRKLGRPSGHRKMMLKNLTTDLLKYGRIETTEARAREVRRVTEKIITLAKKDDLASRRLVLKQVLDETTVKNLFENIAPKYKDRNGGYVRIIKSAPRRGDATPTAIVELV